MTRHPRFPRSVRPLTCGFSLLACLYGFFLPPSAAANTYLCTEQNSSGAPDKTEELFPLHIQIAQDGALSGGVPGFISFKGKMKGGKGHAKVKFLIQMGEPEMDNGFKLNVTRSGAELIFETDPPEADNNKKLHCSPASGKEYKINEKAYIKKMTLHAEEAAKMQVTFCLAALEEIGRVQAVNYEKAGRYLSLESELFEHTSKGEFSFTRKFVDAKCGRWEMAVSGEKRDRFTVSVWPAHPLLAGCELAFRTEKNIQGELITNKSCDLEKFERSGRPVFKETAPAKPPE